MSSAFSSAYLIAVSKSFFPFCIGSFDHVKILRGFREIRSLSGIYGAYSWFTGRHDDFLDDDCEDDDDDDDDGDDDDDEDWKKKFRFGFGMTRFYGFPFLPRVYILGNGEQISVNFKSDKIITFKGFDATYRVVRGNVLFVLDILKVQIRIRKLCTKRQR